MLSREQRKAWRLARLCPVEELYNVDRRRLEEEEIFLWVHRGMHNFFDFF